MEVTDTSERLHVCTCVNMTQRNVKSLEIDVQTFICLVQTRETFRVHNFCYVNVALSLVGILQTWSVCCEGHKDSSPGWPAGSLVRIACCRQILFWHENTHLTLVKTTVPNLAQFALADIRRDANNDLTSRLEDSVQTCRSSLLHVYRIDEVGTSSLCTN